MSLRVCCNIPASETSMPRARSVAWLHVPGTVLAPASCTEGRHDHLEVELRADVLVGALAIARARLRAGAD